MSRRCPALLFSLCACVVLTSCSSDPAKQEAKYLKRGKLLLDKKDYSRAVLEFSNAVKAMPRDAEAHYQLGLAYLGAKRSQQAYEQFYQSVAINPQHAGAQLKISNMLVQYNSEDRVRDAESRLSNILATEPDNPDVLSTLAIARLRLGKSDEAAANLEVALKKFPMHLASAAAMAALRLSKRDVPGAEAVLKGVVAQVPKSAEVGMALAHFYLTVGKLPEAETEIIRILQFDPVNLKALATLAALQEGRQQFDLAETTYRKLAAVNDPASRDAHASFLLRRHRNDEAIAELRKLSTAAPRDRVARTRLIDAELMAGKLTEAQRDLSEALKKNPKDTDALLQRSHIYLRAGRFEEAERDLRFVIDYQRDSVDAHYELSKVYAASGADSQRRQELTETLRLQPNRITVRRELAQSMIANGGAKAALDLMDAAPPSQKNAPDAILGRNWALLALGRLDEAATGIEAGFSHGSSPDLSLQRIFLKMARKDYAAAESEADALLKSSPGNVRALGLLMQSFAERKQMAAAEKRLREVAQQSSPTPEFQLAVGRWFGALGKFTDARSAFEAAKSARPGYPEAELELATLDQMDRDPNSARTRLTSLTKAQPRNSLAWLNLANLEYQNGNRQLARDYYLKVSTLDPGNVLALNNYAYLRAESNADEALKHAEKALEMAPDSAMVLDTLGWVYYRKGMYERAVTYLERAMSREATPRRQFHLGVSLLKCGRADAGNRNLALALQKDPQLAEKEKGW